MRFHHWAGGAFFTGLAGLASANPAPVVEQPEAEVSIVLLGTQGGPEAIAGGAGIATLVTVRGKRYLIDAGEGVAQQLSRARVPLREVGTVLITHLHDDHTVGLSELASFRYTTGAQHLSIFGPPGTNRMTAGLRAFMAANAEIRGAARKLPPLSLAITGREVGPGIVLDDGTVRVTATENTHYNFAPRSRAGKNKSYSLRLEAAGKVIVFTGDTGPSPAVERLAKGADILVAEMVTAADIAHVPPSVLQHMLQEHLSPTEVGKMAYAAGVKKLIISHYRTASEADVAEIRRQFSGEIVLGKELDRF